MMTTNQSTISMLRELIDTCRKSREYFRQAAAAVRSPAFKGLFDSYAEQRAVFAVQLADQIHDFGEELPGPAIANNCVSDGAGAGIIARADDAAIIAESRKREEFFTKVFEQALRARLPAMTRLAVRNQYVDLMETVERLRSLEKTVEPVAGKREVDGFLVEKAAEQRGLDHGLRWPRKVSHQRSPFPTPGD